MNTIERRRRAQRRTRQARQLAQGEGRTATYALEAKFGVTVDEVEAYRKAIHGPFPNLQDVVDNYSKSLIEARRRLHDFAKLIADSPFVKYTPERERAERHQRILDRWPVLDE